MTYEERQAYEAKKNEEATESYNNRFFADAEAKGYDTDDENFVEDYLDDWESEAARDGDFY